jgi:hypothetical protein
MYLIIIHRATIGKPEGLQRESIASSISSDVAASDGFYAELDNLNSGAICKVIVCVDVPDYQHDGSDDNPQIVLRQAFGCCVVDVLNESIANIFCKAVRRRIIYWLINGCIYFFGTLDFVLFKEMN